MTFSNLIIKNVLRSPRKYMSYFFNSLFAVLVFYIFSILRYHPTLNNGIGGNSQLVSNFATIGVKASQLLVIILAFIFLSYSFQSFIKSRQQDITIYQMLGMRPKDVRKILFGENMFIGLLAIVSGIVIGTLFTKVFLLVVANILSLSDLPFYFPSQALVLTFFSFLLVYLIISFAMTLQIERVTLHKGNRKREEGKSKRLLGVIGCVLFLIAGYASVFIFLERSQYWWLLSCILLTIVGTFLFFNTVYPLVLRIKKTKQQLDGIKTLTLSDAIYKAKDNILLFVVIVCSTSVALVGMSVTQVLGGNEFSTKDSSVAAYSFSPYYSEKYDEKDPIVQKASTQIEQWIEEKGYQANIYNLPAVMVTYSLSPEEDYGMSMPIIRLSDYQKISQTFGLPKINPKNNEIYSLNAKRQENNGEEEKQSEKIYQLFGNEEGTIIEKDIPVVLASFEESTQVASDAFVDKVIKNQTQEGLPYSMYTLIDFKEWDQNPELNKQIQNYLSELTNQEEDPILYSSKYEEKMEKKRSNSYILLLAVLLASVFFVFSGSILSFKVFANLEEDIRYHQTLYQIGLKPKERTQIITQELSQIYFLPMVVSILHFTVAFIALKVAVDINIWHYYWIMIFCYILFQVILFEVSKKVYLNKIDKKIF